MSKNCGMCRFMAAEREPYPYPFKVKTPEDDDRDIGHRSCVRIIHGNPDFNERGWAAQEKAAVLDGSGYAARLVVLPTFGCVLHEPKE